MARQRKHIGRDVYKRQIQDSRDKRQETMIECKEELRRKGLVLNIDWSKVMHIIRKPLMVSNWNMNTCV